MIADGDREELKVQVGTAAALAAIGQSNDEYLHAAAQLAGVDTSGNANAFVPWSNPLIPFQCECGETIYADTEHEH